MAASGSFPASDHDVSNGRPLTIGVAVNDFFQGLLSDLRLYTRPLPASEIAALAAR